MTLSKNKVLEWIKNNFEKESITVTEFPLFPSGYRVIDKTGSEMLVYWDILYERVAWTYPEISEVIDNGKA